MKITVFKMPPVVYYFRAYDKKGVPYASGFIRPNLIPISQEKYFEFAERYLESYRKNESVVRIEVDIFKYDRDFVVKPEPKGRLI